jgi:hypothetical protein
MGLVWKKILPVAPNKIILKIIKRVSCLSILILISAVTIICVFILIFMSILSNCFKYRVCTFLVFIVVWICCIWRNKNKLKKDWKFWAAHQAERLGVTCHTFLVALDFLRYGLSVLQAEFGLQWNGSLCLIIWDFIHWAVFWTLSAIPAIHVFCGEITKFHKQSILHSKLNF